jgi:tetratricopeptide (TPR) repeat protein
VAVATALAGDVTAAAAQLDELLASGELVELRANRGALRAASGDMALAEAERRAALDANPELVPAWANLARVLEVQGRGEEAARAWSSAREQACRTPRRYPHGLGTGEVLEWGIGRRALLLWEDDGLRLADLDFHRNDCRLLSRAADR